MTFLEKRSGEVIPTEDLTPRERDAMLALAAAQVQRQLEGLADWYGRRADFSVMPGGDALRQVAKDTYRLADVLQARAEEIDPTPVVGTPNS